VLKPDAGQGRLGKQKLSKGAGDENFPVASWLLPAWARGHVMAFYAFARAADEVADAAHLTAADKRRQLHDFAVQLAAGPAGATASRGSDEVVLALRNSLQTTAVSVRHAEDLLRAFVWDVDHPRTPDWAALRAYCDLSAAPVGRYLIELLGGVEGDDFSASDCLCAALQILNHLQDLKDDFRVLNRIYVPADWMADEGVAESELGGAACSPGLRRVVERMLDGVDDLLIAAKPLPGALRSRALAREAAGILAVAQGLAQALRARDPLAGRVALSRPHMAVRFVWGALWS